MLLDLLQNTIHVYGYIYNTHVMLFKYYFNLYKFFFILLLMCYSYLYGFITCTQRLITIYLLYFCRCFKSLLCLGHMWQKFLNLSKL